MTLQELKQKRGNSPMRYKSLGITDVKIDVTSRKISGYGAIWNNIDDAGDMLVKGCCSKSISERGPGSATNRKMVFLNQHETDEPLGRLIVLVEDEKGLYFEAELDPITKADEVLIQLQSGTLNQFSIGYNYVWDKCEWVGGDKMQPGYLLVKEINLFEISVVTFGCNEETGFEGMKGSKAVTPIVEDMAKLLFAIDAESKSLPFAVSLKVKQLLSKYIALSETEPGEPTPPVEPQKKKGLDLSILTNALNKNK